MAKSPVPTASRPDRTSAQVLPATDAEQATRALSNETSLDELFAAIVGQPDTHVDSPGATDDVEAQVQAIRTAVGLPAASTSMRIADVASDMRRAQSAPRHTATDAPPHAKQPDVPSAGSALFASRWPAVAGVAAAVMLGTLVWAKSRPAPVTSAVVLEQPATPPVVPPVPSPTPRTIAETENTVENRPKATAVPATVRTAEGSRSEALNSPARVQNASAPSPRVPDSRSARAAARTNRTPPSTPQASARTVLATSGADVTTGAPMATAPRSDTLAPVTTALPVLAAGGSVSGSVDALPRIVTPPPPPVTVAQPPASPSVTATSTSAPGATPPPVPAVRGLNREPVLLRRVLPVFPRLATESRVVGDVDLDVQIDATGRVTDAAVVAGPATLRGAARAAVLQWQYQPAEVSGVPVGVRRRVRVSFNNQ